MRFPRAIALSLIIVFSTFSNLAAQEMGHFSSWQDVPAIIDSISENNYRQPLDQLHKLSLIKLGFPQASMGLNTEDHLRHMLQTKQKWRQWWESTGESVSKLKEQDAEIDPQSFQMAWEFLGVKQDRPKAIAPVWTPKEWTLYVTFTNGDYMGAEKELWIVDRQAKAAHLTKLRSDGVAGTWQKRLILSQFVGLSPVRADQVFRALCYVQRYAPTKDTDVPEDNLPGLYYPHSTLRLRDGANRILWNTEGYEFRKTIPDYGDGVSGRSYYFLRSVFSKDSDKWKAVANPTSAQLAPYRTFLSNRKPYFCSNSFDIVQLLGQHGGQPERQSLLDWAEKQKAATNPEMDWKVRCNEFGTAGKENMIGFTRLAFQQTAKEIQRLESRLELKEGSVETRGLAQHAVDLIAAKKAEEEKEIERHPQPLRELIRINEHRDSNLISLSAAVQAIRENPDPELFKQLVPELDEGTLKMQSLLRHILINDHDSLQLKSWGAAQEAIAINACIDALPDAKDASDNLITMLLRSFGGGKIEIAGKHGGRSIEVTVLENGHRMRLGSAKNPLSLNDAQQELRRLYEQSRQAQPEPTDK